ncbi:hypothetical protein [Azospirillum endophyticum]
MRRVPAVADGTTPLHPRGQACRWSDVWQRVRSCKRKMIRETGVLVSVQPLLTALARFPQRSSSGVDILIFYIPEF